MLSATSKLRTSSFANYSNYTLTMKTYAGGSLIAVSIAFHGGSSKNWTAVNFMNNCRIESIQVAYLRIKCWLNKTIILCVRVCVCVLRHECFVREIKSTINSVQNTMSLTPELFYNCLSAVCNIHECKISAWRQGPKVLIEFCIWCILHKGLNLSGLYHLHGRTILRTTNNEPH